MPEDSPQGLSQEQQELLAKKFETIAKVREAKAEFFRARAELAQLEATLVKHGLETTASRFAPYFGGAARLVRSHA